MSEDYNHEAHPQPRRWLNTNEAAEYLGCSAATLNKDRCHRLHNIPFSTLGRRVRYDVRELDAYLEQRKQC